MRFTLTSRGSVRTLASVVLPIGLAILTAASAGAVELELVTANDFLTHNRVDDDLYSFAFGLNLRFGRYDVRFYENAFTDKANDLRFDETYLSVGRPLPGPGRWRLYAEAGVVHVGEGLLGESLQNTVHGALGNEEVHLPYVESSDVHPTLELQLEHDLSRLGPVSTAAQVELYSAPGFQSHAVAAVRAHWPAPGPLTVDARAGARLSDASYDALAPWIADRGPLWELGVTFFDRVALTWNYNDYGTRNQHFRLGYRVGVDGWRHSVR